MNLFFKRGIRFSRYNQQRCSEHILHIQCIDYLKLHLQYQTYIHVFAQCWKIQLDIKEKDNQRSVAKMNSSSVNFLFGKECLVMKEKSDGEY